MNKLFRIVGIFMILLVTFSCVSTSHTVSENRPPLFSFLPLDTKTEVVPTKEKLIASLPQNGTFADIKQIPQAKVDKLIGAIGIDSKKSFKHGETLYAFVNGQVVDVDTQGSTAWGKYILIEGTYNYFLSNGEKSVPFRLLFCFLATIAPDIKPKTAVKANMALGTIQIEDSLKSTNCLLFTPDCNDVFLNFSTLYYPVDYMNNRWFHVYTILNRNAQSLFFYPEWNPHEAAYTYCHWHDPVTNEERRDTPPQNLQVTFIQSGCRFSILLEKKPYVLTSEERNMIENRLGLFRSAVPFGDFVSVTTWKDKDYTYYLFWGPNMNKYIQEEWDPENPALVSAAIITADVATNSIVFYVGEFIYSTISNKLDQVKNTVIKLEN